MNIRRGMNRLFMIAWVVYGGWLLWSIFLSDTYGPRVYPVARYRVCMDMASSTAGLNACNDEFHKDWQAANKEMLQPSWIGFVLLLLAVPPLVVYGVVLFLVKIARWVVAGFRTSKPANPM